MSRVLTGKWQWNEKVLPWSEGIDRYEVWASHLSQFTSNGEQFHSIRFDWDWQTKRWVLKYKTKTGDFVTVSDTSAEDHATPSDSYRVIDFGDGCEVDDDADGAIVRDWFLPNITRDGTIAEKMEQIAENEQKVYQSGYDKALEKGGYNEGYEDGKQAEYDAFWDAVQESGKRTSYVYAFSRWGSEYIRPKYKVVLTAAGSQKHIFYLNKYIKKIEADYFDFSQLPRGTNDNQAFSLSFTDNSKLEEIEDIGLPISYSYELAFAWCTELTKIAKITVDANTILSNAFVNCFKLKDITFEGEIGNDINFKWSTKLTKASIESIINHLSSAVSGKTLTLSKTAVETAFEVYPADYDGDGKTDAWIGNGEEEWYELITPKSNWDIVVV